MGKSVGLEKIQRFSEPSSEIRREKRIYLAKKSRTRSVSKIRLNPRCNPTVEYKTSDRAYRIGQERSVTIYRLITKNTIE